MGRFDYVRYDDIAQEISAEFKGEFENLDLAIDELLVNGREKSLAITKLEEAFMWIGKAIRNEQLARTVPEPDLPKPDQDNR